MATILMEWSTAFNRIQPKNKYAPDNLAATYSNELG
jgi:hypothetical protein